MRSDARSRAAAGDSPEPMQPSTRIRARALQMRALARSTEPNGPWNTLLLRWCREAPDAVRVMPAARNARAAAEVSCERGYRCAPRHLTRPQHLSFSSWRSRNSWRYSLRASGSSKQLGSNQCTVRCAASSGGNSPENSGLSGRRSCHSAHRSGTSSKQSSSLMPPLQFSVQRDATPKTRAFGHCCSHRKLTFVRSNGSQKRADTSGERNMNLFRRRKRGESRPLLLPNGERSFSVRVEPVETIFASGQIAARSLRQARGERTRGTCPFERHRSPRRCNRRLLVIQQRSRSTAPRPSRTCTARRRFRAWRLGR